MVTMVRYLRSGSLASGYQYPNVWALAYQA